MHPNILRAGESAFLIVDMQEAFREIIPDFADVSRRIATFARGARILNVPIFITEQYPKGLGRTVEEIREALPEDIEYIEKTAFSSCGAAVFNTKMQQHAPRQIIVAGIEAHICVNQTVHDLLHQGAQVHLLGDCISSRFEHNKEVAFKKMRESGAIPSSVEMALFELMRDSRHEQFKAIQKLIK